MDRLARPTAGKAPEQNEPCISGEAQSSIRLRVISLGAGVQSTTMALMAAHGEIGPMPDCAIFADTGWEPAAVYEHVSYLETNCDLPFPIIRVRAGNIRDDILSGGGERSGAFCAAPFYTDEGIGRRECTAHYKIEPINKKLRELLGYKPRQRIPAGAVEVWVGISTDEIFRVKPAQQAWIARRWPLIEKRMRRWDCLQWMERHHYRPAPRSACIGCPFKNNAEWRLMRDTNPAEFADAIAVDRLIRTAGREGIRQWMHPARIPLDEVDLSTAEDRGQMNLFNNECEGMCGV